MVDAFLGPSDLLNFNNTVVQSDPYGIAGNALGAWKPDMSTWGPVESGVTSFAKSFLQGLLTNYARQDAAEQLSKVVSVLPQLGRDPTSVAVPEGVDALPFNALKGSAILNLAAQKQAAIQNLLSNGYDIDPNSPVPISVQMKRVIGERAEATARGTVAGEMAARADYYGKPGSTAEAITPTDSPLASGKESSFAKYKKYFNDLIANGQPPVQAATAARAQVEGEIKSNNKSFDDAKAAREYGQNLLQLANTARAGMANAGQTGSSIASAYEKAVSVLAPVLPGSQSEAIQQSAGDTLLDSIAPDVIKMARPTGGGATSDFESRTYLGSGPSSSNTPEANALLVAKLEKLGKLNLDYADFLEAYREANAGSVVGAGKKWNEYKQAYPIFKNGEIDESRPTWQEYFESVGNGQTGATASASAGLPQYTVGELRANGYTESDIATLRLQGRVK